MNRNFLKSWPFTIVFLLTFTVYFSVVTLFKGDLFFVCEEAHMHMKEYDSLGENLLKLSSEVDPKIIELEASYRNGKTYMYFGPFPAILRIVLNFFFPEYWGRWSRLSCLCASIFSVLAFGAILNFYLRNNSSAHSLEKKVVFYTSFIGFIFASPLIFLLQTPAIYHESTLWGFCFSVWGIYFLFKLLKNGSSNLLNLAALSFCSGGALLSRVTYGIPLYLILLLVIFLILLTLFTNIPIKLLDLQFKKSHITTNLLKVLLYISPALASLGFQAWYNFDRFGNPLMLVNYDLYTGLPGFFKCNMTHDQILKKYGRFNITRLPLGITNYFLPTLNRFKTPPHITNKELVNNPDKDNEFKGYRNFGFDSCSYPLPPFNTPVTFISSWILLGALLGLFNLFARIKNNFFLISCTIAFSVEAFLILINYTVQHRYSLEFYPLFIFLYSIFLYQFSSDKIFLYKSTFICSLLVISCLLSLFFNCLSNLYFYVFNTGTSFNKDTIYYEVRRLSKKLSKHFSYPYPGNNLNN